MASIPESGLFRNVAVPCWEAAVLGHDGDVQLLSVSKGWPGAGDAGCDAGCQGCRFDLAYAMPAKPGLPKVADPFTVSFT